MFYGAGTFLHDTHISTFSISSRVCLIGSKDVVECTSHESTWRLPEVLESLATGIQEYHHITHL